MTDLRDQIQTTLGGAYAVERELGGGGMSRIFVAEDTALTRKVVVKVLLPELAAAVNVERFRREIQLAAKLQHPLIVPVLSAGVSDGLPYYTMPFIEGESLRARLARSGELPVQETARILRDVLSALSYAHEHGVVHRDIKPDNILLSGHHAVVTDFGVAKALSAANTTGSSLTSVGVALGTPAYMAPEQAAADPSADHRADLYSVGAMGYEMLTGHQVFSARSPQAMLAAHATEKPEPVSVRRPAVPRQLSLLIERSLEKHAADRPQSAAEMLADLEAAVTPSGATAPEVPPSIARFKSDRRGLLLTIGLAAVMLALASSTMYWRSHRAPSSEVLPDSAPSLAVLPFENLGAKDDDYFAAGITDEISSKLGSLNGLTVIGRQSAKSYANTEKPAAQIGRELGASYLLTGTVRWDKGSNGRRIVKITPVLQRTSGGEQIWSEPYQAEVTGVFDLQAKVAENVADAMRVKISEMEKRSLTTRPTNNADAYENYLRGRELVVGTIAPSNFVRAIAFLERAVELDPRFVLAHAALAEAHVNTYWFRADHSKRRLERAKAYVDTALALDPKAAAGHRALATYFYRGRLDFPRALEALVSANDLEPNDPEVLYLKGLIERRQGKWSDALIDIGHASRLDPRNANIVLDHCETLVELRHYGEAERPCNQAVELAPDRVRAYGMLFHRAIQGYGDVDQALSILHRAKSRVDPAEFRALLINDGWPAVTDPELRAEMHRAEAPVATSLRVLYFANRIGVSIYEKDTATARLLADSILVLAPKSMGGDAFDAWLHVSMTFAYAAKRDEPHRLEQDRLAKKSAPASADALTAAHVLSGLAYSAVLAGSYDEAVADLEESLSSPVGLTAAFLRVDPWFDPLRNDPRFQRLLAAHVAYGSQLAP